MDINLRLNWCKVLNKHINNWRIKTIQFKIIKNLHSNLLETKLFQTNINIWFGWINSAIWLFYSIANSKQLHRMNVFNGMASNARPNSTSTKSRTQTMLITILFMQCDFKKLCFSGRTKRTKYKWAKWYLHNQFTHFNMDLKEK